MSVKSMKSERKAVIARERRRLLELATIDRLDRRIAAGDKTAEEDLRRARHHLRQIDNDRNRHYMSGYMRLYRARKRAEAEQGGE